MVVPVTNELEVLLQSRVGQHAVRVAADGMDLSVLEEVVLVEEPAGWVSWQGALVDDGLTVVLAVWLQWELPETVGGGVELQLFAAGFGDATFDLSILDGDWCVLHETRIGEANLAGHVLEVVPVEGAAEALAPQHLVLLQMHWHATVGVDIGEVELAAWLEKAQALLEDCLLIRAEVDDAVGDDDIEGLGLEVEILELLEISLLELDVGESELLGVVILVLARHIELFICHVDADDLALGSDQLRGDVDVAAGTAAQIEHVGAFQVVLWQAETAAVVLRDDLVVDLADGIADVLWWCSGGAAGVGLEVVGSLEFLAVVLGDGFVCVFHDDEIVGWVRDDVEGGGGCWR
mmetsp:Transcript_19724/g.54859  ORF Transcript_19724/g.54859 Transcript_19724/m.54859 type:complete len:349 (-) Transcript_19724:167-1213(-)